MPEPSQGPADDQPEYDASVPHSARVYNFWLGGTDNFEADREVGEQTKALYPDIVRGVQAQRQFLASAVHYLVTTTGIRQFIDVGTGLPVANNTHEVAQRAAPESRIVYIDNDPLVLAHARALLTSTPEGACTYLHLDALDTDAVLKGASDVLDLSQPTAIMMIGVLHLIQDADDPAGLVRRLMTAVPSGSWLAIAHPASDMAEDQTSAMTDKYNQRVSTAATLRTREEIAGFFDGFDVLPPGVVPLNRWQAGEPGPATPIVAAPDDLAAYCALARKP